MFIDAINLDTLHTPSTLTQTQEDTFAHIQVWLASRELGSRLSVAIVSNSAESEVLPLAQPSLSHSSGEQWEDSTPFYSLFLELPRSIHLIFAKKSSLTPFDPLKMKTNCTVPRKIEMTCTWHNSLFRTLSKEQDLAKPEEFQPQTHNMTVTISYQLSCLCCESVNRHETERYEKTAIFEHE